MNRVPVIELTARRAALFLIAAGAFLFAANGAAHALYFGGLVREHGFAFWIFNLNREGNIPTIYSASLIFFAGILAALIAYAFDHAHARVRVCWTGLALLLMLLAADEALMFHERAGNFIAGRGWDNRLGPFSWIVPYLLLALAAAAACWPIARTLPRRTRRLVMSAGAIYVGGAAGIEIFEWMEVINNPPDTFTVGTAVYASIQELLEIATFSLFIYALLDYIEQTVGSIEFHAGRKTAT